jgi:hypothetical protein
MTNAQLWTLLVGYFASNAILITVLVLYINARIGKLEAQIEALRETMVNSFAAINQRFDDMRQLWLSELHRVEGVLDARLKHLESREG